MASTYKPPAFDYGVVIAFLAPGFVAFAATAYTVPTAAAWMAAAAQKEQSVGIFLFVLLASLSLGLIVSGIRSLIIDNLLRWKGLLRSFAVPQLNLDWALVDQEKLAILIAIRDSHYRYYQFYSNTLVALVLFVVVRLITKAPGVSWQLITLVSFVVFFLLLSAREALSRYVTGINRVLTPLNRETHGEQRLSWRSKGAEAEEKSQEEGGKTPGET